MEYDNGAPEEVTPFYATLWEEAGMRLQGKLRIGLNGETKDPTKA